MDTPVYSGELPVTAAAIEQAAAAGMPTINNQQAVACCHVNKPISAIGGIVEKRTWYMLADGSEVVLDGDGNPAEWDL